jgi:hypothetical protein
VAQEKQNTPRCWFNTAHVLVLSKRTLNAHLDISIAERPAPCGAQLGYRCVRLIQYGTFCGGHIIHTESVETLPGQNSNWADVLTW